MSSYPPASYRRHTGRWNPLTYTRIQHIIRITSHHISAFACICSSQPPERSTPSTFFDERLKSGPGT
ncbi:hypothetical protein FOCG_02732 [Fusarium oxysporum f. sp. radicis-lycopersici 26381]|nr:hypothetical protein FOCG_02732 [Fusarium oxysporum f. sp. radicis-lycopersici 26381]